MKRDEIELFAIGLVLALQRYYFAQLMIEAASPRWLIPPPDGDG